MSLEFIEDGHRYLLDGEEIPSVSEILRFISREVYKEADVFQMDTAADRGKRVHKAAEEYDRKGLCVCDGDISGYVQAYINFLNEHEVKWEMIEQPLVDTIAMYAGTIDRYGIVDGVKTLLDIKTTKRISEKHKLLYGTQLELYNLMDELIPYDLDHIVLQLKDDGTYKIIQLEPCQWLARSCLSLHNALTKKKRRRKSGKVATD